MQENDYYKKWGGATNVIYMGMVDYVKEAFNIRVTTLYEKND